MEAVFNRINTLLPPFLQPQTMVARGVNFLLLRNPWAMQRLAAYAGRRPMIEWGQQSFQIVLTAGGLLQPYERRELAVQVSLIVHRDKCLQMVSAQWYQSPWHVS